MATLTEIRAKLKAGNSNANNSQPKRKLEPYENERAEKLKELIAKLKRGEHVQNRTLQTWLWASEYAMLASDWNEQKNIRSELADKPVEVKEYEELLKKALFTYNKAEGLSIRKKHTAAKKLFGKADMQFEQLLEFLQEIIEAEPSLRSWFDRDTEWTADSQISLDTVGIPRVITSRSANNQTGNKPHNKLSKGQVKIQVLETALNTQLCAPDTYFKHPNASTESTKNSPSSKLAELLKLPEDREDDFFIG